MTVMDIAGSILHSQDVTGLCQMSEYRIVRRILTMVRIESPIRPLHRRSRRDHTAVYINGQSGQRLLFDRFTDYLNC